MRSRRRGEQAPNPSIEATSQSPLRALVPRFMSNVRHQHMRSLSSGIALLLWMAAVQASPDSEPSKVVASPAAASASLPTWSAQYPSRIRAVIVPYIIWSQDVQGNPVAEMEIRTSPDGKIVQARLLKSSGVESWDQSVQAAVAKAGRIPRDVNGQVPPVILMTFRPR